MKKITICYKGHQKLRTKLTFHKSKKFPINSQGKSLVMILLFPSNKFIAEN